MHVATRPAAVLLAAALGSAAPASAQTVSGRVTDGGTGEPIEAVLVELLTLDSTRVRAILTSAAGEYRVALDAPGRVLIRLQRFGYAASVVGPFDVAADRAIDLTLSSQPFTLPAIEVARESRCAIGPESSARAARLWERIRTALEVATVVRRAGLLRFSLLRFVRELDLERRNLLREEVMLWTGAGPFESVAAEWLVRDGFIQPADAVRLSYYMPDPSVILADAFLQTHCFRVVEKQQRSRTLYGLAFSPLEDRDDRQPAVQNAFFQRLVAAEGADVSGVLWVDARTGLLETLEYRYEGLRSDDIADVAGGFAEFEQLAGGAFAVRHWWVRMPVVRLVRSGRRTRLELVAIQDEGGAIVRAETPEGTPVARRPGQRVAGRISAGDLPMALDRAAARLSGTPDFAFADSTGAFAIPDVPPGRYLATFHHPLLDTLGIRGPIQEILVDAETQPIVFVGPNRAGALRRVCPDADVDSRRGTLLLHVQRPAEGQFLIRRVELRLAINGRRIGVRNIDAEGFARFCDVPVGVPLELHGASTTGPVPTSVPPTTGFARIDVRG